MKQVKDKGIPNFNSLEEERAYWEARGPLAEGRKGRVNKPKSGQKRSSFLAVRLTGEELTRLRDAASKQGLGPSTFARLILKAAIEPGRNTPNSMTLDDFIKGFKNLPQNVRDRMEANIKAIAIGDPPFLLELADEKKVEDFARFTLVALLSMAGVQVVAPKNTESEKRGTLPIP